MCLMANRILSIATRAWYAISNSTGEGRDWALDSISLDDLVHGFRVHVCSLLLFWAGFRWLVWRIEEDVAVHAHRELVPGRDLDRWLYVEIAAGDLGTGLTQFLADGSRSDLAGLGFTRTLWLRCWEMANAAVNMLVRTEKPSKRR